MKQISNMLFSRVTTAVLLLIFAATIGIATFVEDAYDTATAKSIVYGAKWFELIMLLLVLNFIGNIQRYKMLRREKLAGLSFHLAFILMIIGAGITRYYGYEGTMHIREGQVQNYIFKDKTYIRILAENATKEYAYEQAVSFTSNSENKLNVVIPTEGLGEIKVDLKEFLPNAVQEYAENQADGVNTIILAAAVNNRVDNFEIFESGEQKIGSVKVTYNKPDSPGINLNISNGIIKISSSYPMTKTAQQGAIPDSIRPDSITEIKTDEVITVNDEMFLVEKIYNKAKKIWKSGDPEQHQSDALIFDVSINGKTHEITTLGGPGQMQDYETFNLDGNVFKISYGNQPIQLPFSLQLERFILDRYAGSMSPSSYESQVILVDKESGINEKHRIYMNNVLDYKGFRFFQSSYDQDEKGTILSVNHDFWGTFVSYLSYFMLGVGFLLTFFSKESRFTELRKKIKATQLLRKESIIVVILVLFTAFPTFSQNNSNMVISPEHADKFGHLIIQTYGGRFAPVQTLADDVLHKISRKDKFDMKEKGELSLMQVFLDIQIDPEYWKAQKIIYIREESVSEALGIKGKYASFYDFFDSKSVYKLRQFSEAAFRKKPVDQNPFDREILKVDERVNIFMMTLQGHLTTIFPLQNSHNNTWISYTDSLAFKPLSGEITSINNDLKLPGFNYGAIMQTYFTELVSSIEGGDYSKPNKILEYIYKIQTQKTDIDGFPSESQLKFEVFYNKVNIFIFLRDVYGALSILLLAFAFYDSLATQKSKILIVIMNILIGILGLAFLYHTFGMGLRWYLTEHAPWSNGYEALLLVAWGGLLAGFGFMKSSKITLAASVLMAFFMLMTAGHSSYDPQLTNLQPVLKSYWLIIHVATLTISYGFLGAGFLLGIINMFLYIFKKEKNKKRLYSVIEELSHINEMNLMIGTFMATLGTFLGGVWANESWGRYWGWDAKETWALVIVIVYAAVLHFRLIPKLKDLFFINAGSILAFGTVLMTFIGVNYFLSKGMHSYAAGGATAIFPLWGWLSILSIFILILFAGYKEFSKNGNSKEE